MKTITALVFLIVIVLADVALAAPQPVKLVTHNQRSSSGTRATLVWKDCGPTGTGPNGQFIAPCINPGSQWNIDHDVVGSNATWTWNSATGVLTGTGLYWVTSYINSSPVGTSVISDRVDDLVIDTTNNTTDAISYQCIEGTFLAGVNAAGCKSINLGFNSVDESVAAWNVGGNPKCVSLNIGGDDYSLLDGQNILPVVTGTPNPRGLTFQTAGQAGLACNQTTGAFDLWTVVQDEIALGGTLILSNGVDVLGCTLPVDIDCQGANWMTFAIAPDALDDGPIKAPPGMSVSIPVMANDTGFTGPNVSVAVVTPPVQGTAIVTGSPGPQSGIVITYTANAAATGADSFTYGVTDADGSADTATVRLSVVTRGANADGVTTHLNTPVNIGVGANDYGFDDPVTITLLAAPDAGGSATTPAPGPAASAVVAYSPAARPPGTVTYPETIGYEIMDAQGHADTAMVTVTVANRLPAAGARSTIVSTRGIIPAGVTSQITIPAIYLGDAGTVTIANQGVHGTATVNGSMITYTIQDPGFFAGEDSVEYMITDVDGETSSANVTITIPDELPHIDTSGALITSQHAPASQLGFYRFAGNGTLSQHSLAVTRQAAHGTCASNGTTVTYKPDGSFLGEDTCVVTLTDGDGDASSTTSYMYMFGDDLDRDAVPDESDNCVSFGNADQRDTDGDGYGNVCDADLNDSGLVTVLDYTILRSRLNTTDPDADLDGSGLVTMQDYMMLREALNGPPGPSGLHPNCPPACP